MQAACSEAGYNVTFIESRNQSQNLLILFNDLVKSFKRKTGLSNVRGRFG